MGLHLAGLNKDVLDTCVPGTRAIRTRRGRAKSTLQASPRLGGRTRSRQDFCLKDPSLLPPCFLPCSLCGPPGGLSAFTFHPPHCLVYPFLRTDGLGKGISELQTLELQILATRSQATLPVPPGAPALRSPAPNCLQTKMKNEATSRSSADS